MQAISKDSVIMKMYKNSLKIDSTALLKKVALDNRKIVLDAEKNQLKFGYGEDGNKIEPSYLSDDYAHKKNMQNGLAGFGNPDLYKSGSMYRNMDLTVPGMSYYFVSNVSYFNDLTDKYKTAFGLSAKSLKIVQDQITPLYFKQYHKALLK